MAFSKEKLTEFQNRLKEDQERISEKLKLLKDTDFGDTPGEDNEEADETEELSNKLGAINVLEERLSAIEDALEKIEDGTYGTCENCNNEIEGEVLEVDPESRLCKSCKA